MYSSILFCWILIHYCFRRQKCFVFFYQHYFSQKPLFRDFPSYINLVRCNSFIELTVNRTEYFYLRSQTYFVSNVSQHLVMNKLIQIKVSISNTYRDLNKNMNFEKSVKFLKCSYISSRESRIKILKYNNWNKVIPYLCQNHLRRGNCFLVKWLKWGF